MSGVPDDLHYTESHEWIRIEGDRAVVGITDYAQDALTDVVWVELAEVGAKVGAMEPCASVESVKSVSVQPPEDLFLEVQNPNRFYADFNEFATSQDIQFHRIKATDTSAEAVFDYLMERSSRPK